jgi:hypothetical protein
MALVDPNIAMGYKGIPLELPNQLAQYAQLSQIQQAQNQNALAQYQLSAAQRADEQQSNLYNAARKPDFKLDFQTAIQYGAPGLAAYKAQQEATKTQGEIGAQDRKAAESRADAFSTALAPLVANVQAGKPLTHEDVFAQANRLVSQGLLRQEDLAAIPMNAAKLPSFVMNMATATENSRKALQTYMPEALVAGGSIVNKNPLAAGGIGNVLGDVSMTKFEAGRLPIMQQQANAATTNALTNQGRLGVEQSGLGLRALQADPFNLNNAQNVFPLTAPGRVGGGIVGAPAAVGAPSVAGAPRAAAPTPTPANAPVADTISGRQMPLGQAINSGLTGPELLSVMPKSLAGQVNAILEHRAAPPAGNTTRSSQLMQIVQAADPTYDAQQYKTKQGIETAFTAGLPARTLKSINVADDHLKVLNSTIDALQNGDVKLLNQLGNAITTQMGAPAPTDFNGVKTIVADELVKAILGGAGALGDRKAIQETVSAASSPEQLRSMIKRYQQLMDGQRTGLAEQYKSGGGNSANVLSLLNKTKPAATQGTGGFTYLGKES